MSQDVAEAHAEESVEKVASYRWVNPDHIRGVDKVKAYMHKHLGDEITLDDMASVMRYSRFHAGRIFYKITGMTPGRYLANLRYQEAARLLLETDMTVTEIAHEVGYTSVGTFSTHFTVHHGVTPTTYALTRCPCGLFDGRRHARSSYHHLIRSKLTSKYMRPIAKHHYDDLDDPLCHHCHTCMTEIALKGRIVDVQSERQRLLDAERPGS